MSEYWLTLAELCPHADGYETEAATRLMHRIEAARQRCGEPEEAARLRLVMGDGHTIMRFETRSAAILTAFQTLGDDESGDTMRPAPAPLAGLPSTPRVPGSGRHRKALRPPAESP